jgi:hypothetical protein
LPLAEILGWAGTLLPTSRLTGARPGTFPETTLHEVLPQTAHGNLGSSTGQLTVDVAGASLSSTGTTGHT